MLRYPRLHRVMLVINGYAKQHLHEAFLMLVINGCVKRHLRNFFLISFLTQYPLLRGFISIMLQLCIFRSVFRLFQVVTI